MRDGKSWMAVTSTAMRGSGTHLGSDPADKLSMAQRYFLF
jgi:hypothetical protein